MSWIRMQLTRLRHFSVVRFVSSILQALGALWLVVELSAFLFPALVPLAQRFWWIFPFFGGLIGLWRSWPQLIVTADIGGTDAAIEIRVCDLFSLDGAVVVAAPTTFDTTLDDDTIDAMSAQGQYTRRYCDSIPNLDSQIALALEGIEYIERDAADKPYGKRCQYPVGTVAPIMFKGKRAYFVAIATLNAHRNAFATREELLDALPALWENIRVRGGMGPIAVPILGSGFSRLNATREELIREIVKSFVAATYAGRFCERLTIVIAPKDFQAKNIDLARLGRFLEHECTYGQSSRTTPTAETPGTAA